ncbi:MAG: hypothetical protein Q8838_02865, partial [Candidatus Phytoplasma australasiaticum]|nr:hypothetical protein [Candidatus Phytoplasma australasiaticum]
YKGQNGPKIMLAGHMDEIGLMVTEITENGFVKFQTIGEDVEKKLRVLFLHSNFHHKPLLCHFIFLMSITPKLNIVLH